jgi:long-chain acyl-CoA synthetase
VASLHGDTPVALPVSDDRPAFATRLSCALKRLGEVTVAETSREGSVRGVSASELDAATRRIASGLLSLGLRPGDVGAILASTDLEWALADVAMIRSGVTSVGIYPTEPPERVAYVLADSQASVIFVDTAEQLAKVRQVRARLPSLRHVVALSRFPGDEDTIALAALETRGDAPIADAPVTPDLPAILIYTSGTTGQPKGAIISQATLDAMVSGAMAAYQFRTGWSRPSYLPLCHVAERLFTLCGLVSGMCSRFVPNLPDLPLALTHVRPHHMLGVPRVYEKLLEQLGPDVPEPHIARERIGLDRAELLLCGGARLPRHVVEGFARIGLTIYDIYGMTEAGVVTTNRPGAMKPGSLGRAAPGCEIRIADDGELLVRGDNVFSGYLNKPDRTAEALRDGWFHTNDIVELDKDGYLYIRDRKNDMLKTVGGKLLAPAPIEERLSESSLIANAIVFGNERRYLTALLLLDEAGCRHLAERSGTHFSDLGSFAQSKILQQSVADAVARANAGLSRVEQIKRYHLIARRFAPTDPEMTPTLKVRRQVFADRYHAEIEAMYAFPEGERA